MRFGSYRKCLRKLKDLRSLKFAAAAVLLTGIHPTPAWSQPHSVTGVNPDDFLNIREDIDYTLEVSASKVVGKIPHNASDVMVTGISVDIGDAIWRQVDYNGTVGWVNERYLKPTSLLLEQPETLNCAGTEPFWSVMIDEHASNFTSPDLEQPTQLEYLRMEPGIGRTDLWAHYLGSIDGKHALTVIVQYTEACSDSMSDLTFDFEAILLGLGGTGAPAHGCCSIIP